MDKRTKSTVQEHVAFLCLLVMAAHLVISSSSSTSWWNLAVSPYYLPSANPSNFDCNNNTFLASSYARSVCSADKKIMLAIARGTHSAIVQCQMEFGNNRWNCTTFLGQYLFGKFITLGNAEGAAVHAFMAAGAAHELAVACRTGAVDYCKCETVGEVRTQDNDGIVFNECSDNVLYATEAMLQVIAENSTNLTDVDVVNNHNYRVGLQILTRRTTNCLCHGISGTCSVKTCYQQAPNVNKFGQMLQWKYSNAVKVTRIPGTTTLKPVYTPFLNESDLAYIADSPDFCTANNELGILGTSGRKCNPNSQGLDSCSFLCCRRGYFSKTITVPQECCQFVWCCYIECTYCKNVTTTDYYCN